MAGYLKLGDIKGKSGSAYIKFDGVDGEAKPLPSDSKNRLRQMGLSMQAISQLESGKLITNQKDMRIIAHIISNSV